MAFHEPGPNHSMTPTAQSEMRDFDVIENNIDVHRIWKLAEPMGFEHIWLSLPALHSVFVGLDQFERVASGQPSKDEVTRVMQNVYNFTSNLRIFALHKKT